MANFSTPRIPARSEISASLAAGAGTSRTKLKARVKTQMDQLEVPYSQDPKLGMKLDVRVKNAYIASAEAGERPDGRTIDPYAVSASIARKKITNVAKGVTERKTKAEAGVRFWEDRRGNTSPKYGLPVHNSHRSKGCIIVESAAGPLQIYFSRYPTQYAMGITANLGRQVIPGANSEAFQKLGAKATEFKMQVLFHNAWLGPQFVTAGTALSLLTQTMKELWAGDTWWQLGASNPKKIIITQMGFTVSDFNGSDSAHTGSATRASVKKDETQKVVVDIAFVLDEGVRAIVPFKPRRRGGKKKPNNDYMIEVLQPGTSVIGGLRGEEERAQRMADIEGGTSEYGKYAAVTPWGRSWNIGNLGPDDAVGSNAYPNARLSSMSAADLFSVGLSGQRTGQYGVHSTSTGTSYDANAAGSFAWPNGDVD